MIKYFVICSACLFLAACERTTAPGLPAPAGQINAVPDTAAKVPQQATLQIDLSSPDRAVKTWWDFIDARSAESHAECLVMFAQDQKDKTRLRWSADKLVYGAVLHEYEARQKSGCREPNKFSREILEVKVESETRAIVFAHVKNVTVPDPRSVPSEFDLKRRDEGVKSKYLLEKTAAGWRVAQVYESNRYKLKASEPDWNAIYTDTKDTPASYPSMTFGPNL